MRIGAHMSIAGGMDLAVDRALALGCEALQVFVKSSNQWSARPLKDDEIHRFRDKVHRAGLQPVIAHDSYLINVGTRDPVLWQKSLDALDVEVSRCESLEIPYLVMHPGAHCGAGEDAAFESIARALNELHARHRSSPVSILLENTAGQGTVVGHRFEQLRAIIDRVRCPERLGVCFDTQHAFAAGYDISTEAGWQATWDAFARVLGWDRLKALHINDSKKPLGSRVDRHEHIGLGLLGAETFVRLMNDPRFESLPASIETEKTDGGFEDEQNLAVLRGLRGRKRAPAPALIARWRAEARRRARAVR